MEKKHPKSVAVMQPYIFPYIGYFQLIRAVDEFVFYDDVNFIKRGWINRNRLLINGDDKLISFPCVKPSQNKLIKDIKVDTKQKNYSKILKTIKQSYKKAPNFDTVMPLIEDILTEEYDSISELAIQSVERFIKYIEMNTITLKSSEHFHDSNGLDKADRLIHITKSLDANNYVNAAGGKTLYSKNYFTDKGINLKFLKPQFKSYNQFDDDFCARLISHRRFDVY